VKILEDGGHRFNKGNCVITAFVEEAIKGGKENKPKSSLWGGSGRVVMKTRVPFKPLQIINNMFSGQNGHDSDFSQVLTTW